MSEKQKGVWGAASGAPCVLTSVLSPQFALYGGGVGVWPVSPLEMRNQSSGMAGPSSCGSLMKEPDTRFCDCWAGQPPPHPAPTWGVRDFRTG